MSRRRAGRGDDGSASILLLGVGALVVSVGLAAALVGSATAARHQAQVAADLGALAGAREAVSGQAVACQRAAWIAGKNRARLASCRLDGLDLTIRVEVAVPGALPGTGPARASARAGPARVASPSRYSSSALPGRPAL